MSSISNRKSKSPSVNHYTVIRIEGIINTIAFQKAKWCALLLYDRFPSTFSLPKILEMFQMEWFNYLEKARRHIGGKIWLLSRPVAVFINDHYIGSDIDFIDYINELYVISIPMDFDFYENLIIDNLKKTIEKSRRFVFFTFDVDGVLIGSFLFMLYSDLLPQTCEYFLNLCVENGTKLPGRKDLNYKNSLVHRIVKNRWLQLGDIGSGDSPEETTPNESYCIAHDRCGVLSLSNDGTCSNGPQFIVCLNPNPWMDRKYIAFGQLIDGARTLKRIEGVPTHYESPIQKIMVSRCGEYFFGDEPQLEIHPDICLDYADSFQGEIDNGAKAPSCTPDRTE